MLDYDGTLAPIRIERDKAYPYTGIRGVLDAIVASGNTRLVIISGRDINDLIPLISLKKVPEIWGSHGSERLLSDGTYNGIDLDDATIFDFEKADEWLEENDLSGLLEKKPGCRAIHIRGLEKGYADDVKKKVLLNWSDIVKGGRLEVHEFNGGVELRVTGHHKGIAIDTILSEMGDDSFSVYLGDDITDEDAFMAIKGRGVGVLVRKERRTTHADIILRPPGELLEFLRRWEEELRGT